MSQSPDEAPGLASPAGDDRRRFLQKAGLGAAALGAWVAPQVLFTASAAAGCTPIDKLLQISACSCTAGTTSLDANLPGCVPVGWATGRNDGVTFTCSSLLPNPCQGSVVTITRAGCTPTSGQAVKFCPLGSGGKYRCVAGTVSGSTIQFPAMTFAEQAQGCIYVDYRITVRCCT